MIDFKNELSRFKPSLDVDDIEDVISGADLTDMNDLMMQLIEASMLKGYNDRREQKEQSADNDN